jgi:hypothetical protein
VNYPRISNHLPEDNPQKKQHPTIYILHLSTNSLTPSPNPVAAVTSLLVMKLNVSISLKNFKHPSISCFSKRKRPLLEES